MPEFLAQMKGTLKAQHNLSLDSRRSLVPRGSLKSLFLSVMSTSTQKYCIARISACSDIGYQGEPVIQVSLPNSLLRNRSTVTCSVQYTHLLMRTRIYTIYILYYRYIPRDSIPRYTINPTSSLLAGSQAMLKTPFC